MKFKQKMLLSILAASGLIWSSSVFAQQQLIVNGDFGQGTAGVIPTDGDNEPAGWQNFQSNDPAWDGITAPGTYSGHPAASPTSGGNSYGDGSDSSAGITSGSISQTTSGTSQTDLRRLDVSLWTYAGTNQNGGVTITLQQNGTTWTRGPLLGNISPQGAPSWTQHNFSWSEGDFDELAFTCDPITVTVGVQHGPTSAPAQIPIHGYWVDDVSVIENNPACYSEPKAVPVAGPVGLGLLMAMMGLLGLSFVRGRTA